MKTTLTKSHKKLALLFSLVLISCIHVFATQTVRFVNLNATGANDGTSWTDAFTDLQNAITAANSYDQIWVAQGTYFPTSGTDRTVSFALKDNVKMYGGFVGTETLLSQRDWVSNITILSGDIGVLTDNTDNSYHVVKSENLSSTTELNGFTVEYGQADGIAQDYGGGMYLFTSYTTLNNLIFSQNVGDVGGGLAVLSFSSPTLTNVSFISNNAFSYGGGIYCDSSDPSLTKVVFTANNSSVTGGGMFNSNSSSTLTNAVFNANHASDAGGAFYNQNSSPSIKNTIFTKNYSSDFAGAFFSENGGTTTVTNCTFEGNYIAAGYPVGSAIAISSSTININNCIFYNNSYDYHNNTVVGDLFNDGGTLNITNSDHQSFACPTCLAANTDPQFVNANNGIGADNI